MEVTGRRTFLGLISMALTAETRDELREVIARMATSLSAGNFAAFLKPIDRQMPGYEELRAQLASLAASSEVSSSVEIQSATGDETKQSAKIDWYMALKSREEQTVTTQRRETLSFHFEKRGKQWIVTSITPIDFFSQP